MSYPNYDERAEDCVRFVRSNWANSVRRGTFNGVENWYWRNVDGDYFTYETEQAACVDFCLETGVTEEELNECRPQS